MHPCNNHVIWCLSGVCCLFSYQFKKSQYQFDNFTGECGGNTTLNRSDEFNNEIDQVEWLWSPAGWQQWQGNTVHINQNSYKLYDCGAM